MTPLRRRMIEDMKLKNLSTRTINAYVSRVSYFARHFGRSPEHLGRDDVRSYLLHLIQEKKVSWSVYNQTLCALRLPLRGHARKERRPGTHPVPQATQAAPRRPQPRTKSHASSRA